MDTEKKMGDIRAPCEPYGCARCPAGAPEKKYGDGDTGRVSVQGLFCILKDAYKDAYNHPNPSQAMGMAMVFTQEHTTPNTFRRNLGLYQWIGWMRQTTLQHEYYMCTFIRAGRYTYIARACHEHEDASDSDGFQLHPYSGRLALAHSAAAAVGW